MRVVFMGTPEFAVPSLKALFEMENVEVVGVFTQPDRPVGRGRKVEITPVKREAEEHNVPVFQFERVRKQEGLDAMRALKPDIVVTAAFGQILSKKLLEVPRLGTVNVHASLLPRHRGAAPINWAIISGDKVTGVTTMLTDAGLDTGDMLLKKEVIIEENETAGQLTQRLSLVGAELLRETLSAFIRGEIVPVKQNEEEMTYDPMMTKELGKIDWTKTAGEIDCLVRGVNPWPGAFSRMNGDVIKVWLTKKYEKATDEAPGTVIAASAKEGLIVACGNGETIEIIEMQAPNAKRMTAKAYLSGKKLGARFDEE
ncbi:MAG: methionyl-tRNA formyltransferase [Clostridia bacterium]|nr:methionyl-tRNA formyltransferase [Clostridia bacterium]MBQ9856482.1 methionyl-tRNA formyltransferase [Clostridia bacterium]